MHRKILTIIAVIAVGGFYGAFIAQPVEAYQQFDGRYGKDFRATNAVTGWAKGRCKFERAITQSVAHVTDPCDNYYLYNDWAIWGGNVREGTKVHVGNASSAVKTTEARYTVVNYLWIPGYYPRVCTVTDGVLVKITNAGQAVTLPTPNVYIPTLWKVGSDYYTGTNTYDRCVIARP